MFCKFVKLTNGEDIIVSTDDPCLTFKEKEFIDVVDPVALGTVRLPRPTGIIERFVMYPWLKLSKPDVVRLPVKSILLVTDLETEAQKQYLDFVQGRTPNFTEEGVDQFEEAEEDDDNHHHEFDGRTLH